MSILCFRDHDTGWTAGSRDASFYTARDSFAYNWLSSPSSFDEYGIPNRYGNTVLLGPDGEVLPQPSVQDIRYQRPAL